MAIINGDNGNNTLNGTPDNDTIRGEGGNDTIDGAGGNDVLEGGKGKDTVLGGEGNDRIEVQNNDAEKDVRISGGTGTDTIKNTNANNDFRLSNVNNDSDDDGTAEFNSGTGTVVGGIEKIDGSGRALLGTNQANHFDFSGVDLNVSEVRTEGGNDTVIGSDLDNRTYKLGSGNDSFTGTGNKKDTVRGESGNDTIDGADGNDVLEGGAGNDTVLGGAGNDRIEVQNKDAEKDVRISGGTGTDTIKNTNANKDFRLSNVNNDTDDDGTAEFNNGTGTVVGGIEKIDGSGRALLGTNQANHFDFSGVDLNVSEVRTEGGNDTVIGSDLDNRTYKLGSGNDSFTGTGNKKDTVRGESGNDTIDGADGNDVLEGGAGNDTVLGGAGNDRIEVQNKDAEKDVRISGGTGTDTIKNTNANKDFRLSNVNNDSDDDGTAEFNSGTGTVVGGIEKIDGSGRALLGTNQANHFDFSGVDLNVSEVRTLNGNDTVIGSDLDNRTYKLGSGNDSFVGTGNKKDTVQGESGNDTIDGAAGNDVLDGGKGNDTLTGGTGNDNVNAGANNDVAIYVMSDNVGNNDTYDGSTGTDALRLVLTGAEWAQPDVQADIAAFLDAIAQGQTTFNFQAFNLTALNFEALEVTVDGVAINPVDEPVDAVDDSGGLGENGSFSGNVLDNDSVPDLVAGVSLVQDVTRGQLTFNGDGSFTFDTNGDFDFLADGETTTESFIYQVTDADGDSDTATATLTITGTNDAPTVAAALAQTAAEDDGAFTLDLLAGATDVDTGETATLTVANVGGLIAGLSVSGSTLSIDPADAAFQSLAVGDSAVATVTYDVVDAQGASVGQTATITITGTNDAPTVAAALTQTAAEDDVSFTVDLLSGATDVDAGETATLTVANVAGLIPGVTVSGSTLSVDPADAAFQSLAVGDSAVATVTYDVVDAQGASVEQTATITITGTNDAPTVAAALAQTAAEDDGAFTLDLLAGATDVDTGETATLTVANVSGLIAGLSVSGSTLSVDPADAAFQSLAVGDSAVATVTYDVVDAQGASVEQTATITITGTNDAPTVTAALAQTAAEDDASFTVDLLAGAADVDTGETVTLTVANVAGLIPGVTVSGSTLSVDPADAAFQGLAVGDSAVATVTYDVVDAQGVSVGQTATITITGTNDAPTVAAALAQTAAEDDVSFTVDLLAGAADVDTGETATLTVANVGGLIAGLSVSGSTLSVDPADAAFQSLAVGDSAVATVTYDVVDAQGASVGQTATITITGTNDAPTVAAALAQTAAEDDVSFTLDLLAGAADVDTGETATLTVANVGGLIAGLSVSGSMLSVDPADAAFQSLAVGDSAVATVTYDVVDAQGASVAQTATITITGTNDAPTVAAALAQTAAEDDVSFTLDLLSGATDVDTGETATLTVANVVGLIAGLSVSGSTLSVDPADAAFQSLAVGDSAVATVTYDVVDAQGASVAQTATITITGTNDAPTVAAALTQTAAEDEVSFTVDLLAGAADVDTGETATLTVANVAGLIPGVTVSGSTLSVDPADAAFQSLAVGDSAVATVTYDVVDAQGASVAQTATITITGTNDAPTVAAALAQTAAEDEVSFTVDLLSGAADVDTGETATLTVANVVGLIPGVTVSGSTLSVDPADAAFQSLAVGDSAVATVTYDVVDAQGASVAQTATITITGTNDAPTVAAALAQTAAEDDVSFTLDLLSGATDVDTGETATLTVANVVGLIAGLSVSGSTLSVDPADAAFQSLAVGDSAVATVTYDVVDAQGASVAQTATITITGTNDAPTVAAALTQTAAEDEVSFTVDLLAGAADVDTGETATLTVANVAGLIPGVTVSGSTLSVDPADAAFQSLAVGDSAVATVTYDVVDAQGASVAQTATITITGTNDAPTVAAALAQTAAEDDVSFTVDLLSGAADVDTGETATLTVANVGGLIAGLSVSGSTLSVDPADAAFQSLAVGDSAVATVTYDVVDAQGASVGQTATITITGTNDAPTVAAALAQTAAEDDVSFTVDLLAGATDVDTGETATLTVANVAGLIPGVTVSGSTLSVDPADAAFQSLAVGDSAVATVTYDVVDAQGVSVAQTATITITGTNDLPILTGDVGSVTEDTVLSTTGTVTISDIDTGESSFQVIPAGTPGSNGYGTFEVTAAGAWTYTLDNANAAVQALPAGGTLMDTITVTSFDGTATETIAITINGVADNLAPVAKDDSFTGDFDVFFANFNGQGNSVWLNDGAGIFTDSLQSLGSSQTVDVGLGDLDNDGDLDAFTANFSSQHDLVWLNDGTGSFTDSLQTLGTTSSNAVAFGELDNVAGLDAFVSVDLNHDQVWLNDGSGTFTNSGQNLNAGATYGVALADFDSDGDLDVFGTNLLGTNFVMLNDGTGVFTDAGQSVGQQGRDAAAGDLDSDGDIDVFVANRSGHADQVWLNDGAGNFTSNGQALGNSDSQGLALGDVDGDGDLDAFIANRGGGNLVWVNDGFGQFTDSGQILGNFATTSVEFADIDYDGDLDAITSTDGAGNRIWLNDGIGNFTVSGQQLGAQASWNLELGDLDQDGFSEDASVNLRILDNDQDPDGDAVSITSVGTAGLSSNGAVVSVAADGRSVVYDPTNAPALQALGAGVTMDDTFTYTISDGNGGTDTATVVVTVAGANDLPTGTTNAVTIEEDTTRVFAASDFGYSDADGNLLDAVRIDTLPGNGQLLLEGTVVGAGQIVSATDIDAGKLTFTPAADANGAAYASFTFSVSDGIDFDSSPKTLTVDVTSINDAPTFLAGQGFTTTDISGQSDSGMSVVVQPDGAIVVSGHTSNGSDFDFAIRRYNSDGSVDPTYGTGGGTVTPLGSGNDFAAGLTLQSNGSALVSGTSFNGTANVFALVRYDGNGDLDPTFGTGGIVSTPVGADAIANDVVVQSDGAIVVAGRTTQSGQNDFALARYDSSGVLDPSFGIGGIVTTSVGPGNDDARSLTLQSDGKILVTGFSLNLSGSSTDFALVRYDTSGTLDPTFGSGGIVHTDFAGGSDIGYRVAVQPDGAILVAGYPSGLSDQDFGLVRYTSSGTLDATFGIGGKVITPIGPGADIAYDLAIQPDGAILVGGYSVQSGGNALFTVARYDHSGNLDTSFGVNGIATHTIGNVNDYGREIALLPDGRILIAGNSNNGTDADFALMRIDANGSLDTTFGTVDTLGDTAIYTVGGQAVQLDDDVTIYDAELSTADNFAGASLTVERNTGATADDVLGLLFDGSSSISVSGSNLIVGGNAIAAFASSGGTLTVNFTDTNGEIPTNDLVNEVLRAVTYENTSANPPASVDLNWAFSDGNAGAQGAPSTPAITFGTTTVAINNAPTDLTFSANDSLEISASSTIPAATIVASVASVSDVDLSDSFQFSLLDDAGGTFQIDSLTGDISLVGTHDASTPLSDSVTIQVEDSAGASYAEDVGIRLGTNGSEILTGSSQSDIVFGFNGADTLNGGDGDDFLISGDSVDYSGLVLSHNPVAYYRMSDTTSIAADESGNGLDGSYVDNATSGALGVLNADADTAATLDGSGDYVGIGDAPDFQLNTGTVQLWFNTDSLASPQGLISRDNSGFDGGGHLDITLTTSGQVSVRHQSTSDNLVINSGAATVNAGEWHLLTYTWGSTGVELYLDDQLVASSTTARTLAGNFEPWTIGASQRQSFPDGSATPLVDFFDGQIDEVAIYGTPLSSSEISDLYNAALSGVNDSLDGGAGADVIKSGSGDDELTGGAGNDLFVMGLGSGNDVITDFIAGAATDDVIDVSAYGFSAFDDGSVNDVESALSDVGSDVVLQLDANNSVTLQGITKADLTADDFDLN